MNPPDWRLLVDPPASGAWNMAVDEAILDTAAGGGAATTFRLYAWQPAALSLGANQPAAYAPRFLRDEGIHLVRRPTGGSAVLHEHERTYALSGALRTGVFSGAVLDTYLLIAEALVGALALLGVRAGISARDVRPAAREPAETAACFGRTSSHEIRVDGRKLIGSAQVRRRGAFLQHGSIPLDADPSRLARAIGGGVGEPSIDLNRALGHPVAPGDLTRALVAGFEERFGVRLRPGTLTGVELEHATRLYSRKYLSAAWTLRPAVSRPD